MAVPSWLTMITTASYAPGVIALALSLEAVGSRARLRVLATNNATLEALHAEMSSSLSAPPQCLDFELMEIELPLAEMGANTHGGRGATLAVDAPRRALWLRGDPFVLLDCDMIALQNPDELLDILLAEEEEEESPPTRVLWAVPAFRLKKRAFGHESSGGGFNAGVMIVRRPLLADAETLEQLVINAGPDDTEESMLNVIFKEGRWTSLRRGFNVPKRVCAHAPELWAEMLMKREIIFLHFLGAKPWMKDIERRRGADWESERIEYTDYLEPIWWKVRVGGVKVGKDGTLLHLFESSTSTS
jgi:hypothetical protein